MSGIGGGAQGEEGELQSSASVSYARAEQKEGRKKGLVLETDTTSSLKQVEGASYVRVFPTAAEPKVTAIKGTRVKVGSAIPLKIDEWISFAGSSSSALKYGAVGSVSISEAEFFGTSPPSVSYSEEDGSIVLSKVAHGIVRVKYTAQYDRYIVHHDGNPCAAPTTQTQGDTIPEQEKKNYDPAFLVAEASGYEMASLEVAGPGCGESTTEEGAPTDEEDKNKDLSFTIQFADFEPPGILIEEDAAIPPGLYPYYFNASNTPLGFTLAPQTISLGGASVPLYAGCRIRVYPRVPVSLIGVNCAVGSSPLGGGSKPVLRALTFGGKHSVSLDYPASSSVSLSGIGTAVSIFGESVVVDFRKYGDWVNEVVWIDSTTFRLAPGARAVRENEVVAVDGGNNTLPCYTFCQVQYTSDYYLYDVLFNWDFSIGWYAPAMVLAIGANGFGSKELSPPGRGGVL